MSVSVPLHIGVENVAVTSGIGLTVIVMPVLVEEQELASVTTTSTT